MTNISQRKYVVEYFSNYNLLEGRDYTYSGLRSDRALTQNKLIGIEFFGGFWRTYVAERERKTDYMHWNSFSEAASFLMKEINVS